MNSPSRPARLRSACSCTDLVSSIETADDGADTRLAGWRAALSQPDSLRSHYQPIFDAHSMEVVAHEALLRVVDPSSGTTISPGEMFAAAMQGGWHQALDQAARRTAILGAGSWLGDALLFVNFLPSSIYNPQVCLRTTEAAVVQAGVSMQQLVFEVVESEHIASVPHLREIFDRYHEMGAKVALDDLGAGHATLEVAMALRPDVMKIDGEIARALPAADAVRFVTDVVALGADLGAQVLIEGVEEREQLDCAIELGVDLAQGYLLGRPAAADVHTPVQVRLAS